MTQTDNKLFHNLEPSDRQRLISGEHHDPHTILGRHPLNQERHIIRAWHPAATTVEVLSPAGRPPLSMIKIDEAGLFAVEIKAELALDYHFRYHFADDNTLESPDPYRFAPSLGELDLHLINEGSHQQLFAHLGAHPCRHEDCQGVSFAVWAPNARRVSVVGDFNFWDGRLHPMRSLGASGIWELFIPELGPGNLYKFEILTREGQLRLKTDPLAFAMETRPDTAAIVYDSQQFSWTDEAWQEQRGRQQRADAPLAIYEVHLGSWKRCPEEANRWLSYRELAPQLVSHVKEMGFTHIELLPVSEYPFDGSWGYQVAGYYAPTSRYGSPDDFKFFVDYCHRHDIGVILDWVPAHFPKDDFSLRRFDGTALYEHDDPRLGEHPDWGTLIFNFGRPEVRNFLLANAFFWFAEYHIDGLRVDAVASMLYLDYSRRESEWLPNIFGGRENLEAISFLQGLNQKVSELFPDRLMIAEESTSWPGVSRPPAVGGLGFNHKWNMGWMNDTLDFFAIDPLYRSYHHNQITFSIIYAFSEHFLLPFSHDEVVHGKGSLWGRMPGDNWQKFANLRLLLAYQFTHPGKKLLFMGTELAPADEWNFDRSLDWHLLDDDPERRKFFIFCRELIHLYRRESALWELDDRDQGFSWIDCHDHKNSVLAFKRRNAAGAALICILNLTPVTRHHYQLGMPAAGQYREIFNSDAAVFGGSNQGNLGTIEADAEAYHCRPASARITLPPLAALILKSA